MKMLVIEGERSLLNSILEFFTREQYVCEGAGNYLEAIRKIEDYQYDCIILDIQLPGGSGLQILKQLQRIKKVTGSLLFPHGIRWMIRFRARPGERMTTGDQTFPLI